MQVMHRLNLFYRSRGRILLASEEFVENESKR